MKMSSIIKMAAQREIVGVKKASGTYIILQYAAHISHMNYIFDYYYKPCPLLGICDSLSTPTVSPEGARDPRAEMPTAQLSRRIAARPL